METPCKWAWESHGHQKGARPPLSLFIGGREISLQTGARGILLFLQRSTFGGICEGNEEHS
ncbi:hypothetical protein FQN60_004002 [Etheostoma spectabile]|uniref:Uncharacterized protein n=1 Tax=Etheostoma spectabile TaxID=54343 RepID=A0A5J5CSG5_9PERO|nr:hypothetical protein FQN60_004002 [Etheostoma spectabile]